MGVSLASALLGGPEAGHCLQGRPTWPAESMASATSASWASFRIIFSPEHCHWDQGALRKDRGRGRGSGGGRAANSPITPRTPARALNSALRFLEWKAGSAGTDTTKAVSGSEFRNVLRCSHSLVLHLCLGCGHPTQKVTGYLEGAPALGNGCGCPRAHLSDGKLPPQKHAEKQGLGKRSEKLGHQGRASSPLGPVRRAVSYL